MVWKIAGLVVKERRNYDSFIAGIGVRAPLFFQFSLVRILKSLNVATAILTFHMPWLKKMEIVFFVVF